MMKYAAFSAITLMYCAVLGCGEPAAKRYHVAGRITWDGQPLKAGYITFNPDSKKGNSGPQGIAMIKDGTFDTRLKGGRGTSPGAQVLERVFKLVFSCQSS